MATSTILGISTVRTVPLSDDSLEVQSVASGSGQIPVSLLCGRLLANDVYPIGSATNTLFTISYRSTLPVVPTKIRLTFYTPSTSSSLIQGNVVSGTISNMSFQVQLFGPTGDTTHSIFWEALA